MRLLGVLTHLAGDTIETLAQEPQVLQVPEIKKQIWQHIFYMCLTDIIISILMFISMLMFILSTITYILMKLFQHSKSSGYQTVTIPFTYCHFLKWILWGWQGYCWQEVPRALRFVCTNSMTKVILVLFFRKMLVATILIS